MEKPYLIAIVDRIEEDFASIECMDVKGAIHVLDFPKWWLPTEAVEGDSLIVSVGEKGTCFAIEE